MLIKQFDWLTLTSVCVVTLFAASCSNNDSDAGPLFRANPEPIHIAADNGDICDLLDQRACLLPFPSNFFTRVSSATDTDLQVNFSAQAMPKNTAGVPVDPAEWNRNDGFSPGAASVLQVPGIDLAMTDAAPLTDIERSLDGAAPIVVIDASSGEKQPIWAELDANAVDATGDIVAAQQSLIIRPAKNYRDGGRYIVALRRLKNGADETIEATDVFRAYRDNIPTDNAAVESRRPAMEDIFATLEDAGIDREDLYLAWDFTVASTRNLSERMLHIRDDAFAALGGTAPTFSIESVTDPSTNEPDWGRRVEGTLTVPNYMSTDLGEPGSRFNYAASDPDLPARLNGDNTLTQGFVCNIPQISLSNAALPIPPQATRPYLYGHGVLGNRSQANSEVHQAPLANNYDMLNCAVDWLGLSDLDAPNVIAILQEGSNFPSLADRLQQGFLGFLFLAEALRHPQGFRQDAAFQVNGQPVYDNSEVFYNSNSQGAILGTGLLAIAQNVTTGVLGVPGMNYSLLLRRSKDFEGLKPSLQNAYPDVLDQTLILGLFQMLWDRGEGNGYANHLTRDPLPGTPPKQVLLHVAFGDHQVTEISAEILARTIDAAIQQPATVPGRDPDVNPYFDIMPISQFPFDGSAMIVWDGGPGPNDFWNDTGTPVPPVTNTPPRMGNDPHLRPRAQPAAWEQISAFMRPQSRVINVCGEQPCFDDGWDGTLP